MTYPSITPVNPGRDGWSVLYADEVSRLLYLCGLRAEANVVQRTRTALAWGVAPRAVVKDAAKTPQWDSRTIRPTLQGVTGVLKSLARLRGQAMANAILHRYGAKSPIDLDKRWYGTVYQAATEYIRESAR